MKTFTQQLQNDFIVDPEDNVVDSLVSQYERVIVDSIITSFGLDFLLFQGVDQHGGDVDTIHNVRQIGIDPKMKYKEKINEEKYQDRGEYSYASYHQGSKTNYAQMTHEARMEAQRTGKSIPIKDEYTGGTVYVLGKSKGAPPDKKAQLDHVLTAKTIHDDRGRVLSGLRGEDLADARDDLRWTNASLNTSMGATKDNFGVPVDIPEYIKLHPELPEETKVNMLNGYTAAKASYEAKLRTAYYTSPQFFKDTAKAAGKVGALMGARQLFGFIFMEIWISVRAELNKASSQDNFDIEKALRAIGNGIKQGAVNAKAKYKNLIAQLGEGMVAGALGSITTTLCNIFFTTAKNTVRIIRQAWASLTEATSILLFNPDNLLFGERFRAAAKVISAGASLVVGRTVEAAISEAIVKTPLISIPVVCEVTPTFCGVFLTGIMSCTLLHYLDRSKLLNKAIRKLNELPTIELSIMEFKQQAIFFKQYAAELMQIDIDRFEKEVNTFTSLAKQLDVAENEADLNSILKGAYKQLGIMLPWQGDFDAFMQSKDHLVFE